MNSVVSLFCGCGGVDLGTLGGFNFNKRKYEPHPCKLVYACDIDQKAVDSHKLNFGSEGAVCADICEVDERDIPECDILTGSLVSHLALSIQQKTHLMTEQIFISKWFVSSKQSNRKFL